MTDQREKVFRQSGVLGALTRDFHHDKIQSEMFNVNSCPQYILYKGWIDSAICIKISIFTEEMHHWKICTHHHK